MGMPTKAEFMMRMARCTALPGFSEILADALGLTDDPPAANDDECRRDLEQLTAERDDARKERDAAVARAEKAERERDDALTMLENARAKARDVDARIAAAVAAEQEVCASLVEGYRTKIASGLITHGFVMGVLNTIAYTIRARSTPAPVADDARAINPNIPGACRACGEPLRLDHIFVDDGCPCNSPRGVNFEPMPCAVCGTDCVKPGHRLSAIFGFAGSQIAEQPAPAITDRDVYARISDAVAVERERCARECEAAIAKLRPDGQSCSPLIVRALRDVAAHIRKFPAPAPQPAAEPSDEEMAEIAFDAHQQAEPPTHLRWRRMTSSSSRNAWLAVVRALRARLARPVVVTDEMVERAVKAFWADKGTIRAALEAALGAPR